ncbi:YchJ family protein [Cellulomonas telluris]|uniref:YchJ family protein n=1 Tax=Cellulomonas telluris TaxID=2306636 RepID=UPI001CA3E9A5|nr:YchJ family protein [Cellulomonas telluris]
MGGTRPADDARCPCGSGDTFADCCGRYLTGAAATPTAEALMRSRYTAFATGDAAYLRATWHSSTRPARLDLDEDVRWVRLDVLGTQAGGPFDDRGVVEFVAHHRGPDGRGRLHETSRFVREGGRWSYVDGDVGG